MTSKINSSVGIPAIDLAHYFDGTDKKGVAGRIAGACEDLGFFSITGHGVPLKLIQDVNLAARSFFDLPAATKRATATGEGMGYIDSGGEKLAAGLDDPQTVDKKESLNLGLPVSLPVWPTNPSELEGVCQSYYRKLTQLSHHLMRLFALALNQPETWFDDKIDPPRTILRLLNYPEVASGGGDLTIGNKIRAGSHTDYGTLTILWSPDLRGLQAKDRDGNWVNVDAPIDHFVINIGDLMMNWTNDRWISTVHRVVWHHETLGKRRESQAFFHNPNPNSWIECIDSCKSEENPAKYEPILAKNHLEMKIEKSLGQRIKL